MSNPNPSQENLITFETSWQHTPTKTYRIPAAIAPQVLEIAHRIDKGITVTSDTQPNEHSLRDAIAILTAALEIKANKGRAIKDEIRLALEIMHRC